ncbi:anhydro-N-acetylmuramic acid kinase [Gammaproteobacteria bacterium AB-CW1]|uniref:Anhydro-N-acetylmuramic acid kinase n=1 Tax=Natronospira elongata TaxID=3110268 RepID=A0AAP6JHV2_9GAMM|nr:anhydro-N-acetylmuramic acid kinase [Gammaproteobacteria bacterium AB-CW1]
MAATHFIGLMSGTSLDGVDAALLGSEEGHHELLAGVTRPFPPQLAKLLSSLCRQPEIAPDVLAEAETAFCQQLAEATEALLQVAGLDKDAVTAVGSHGQTIRHLPDKGWSWQIGSPARLACLTGLPVVADFRSADLARGGQGAPLAPAFHQAFFSSPEETRLVLNLGGIANVSLLRPDQAPIGWDTGPANTLLDAWHRKHHPGAGWDPDGQWAASGETRAELLQRLLDDDYFRQAPPKSTGPEHFNLNWLAKHGGRSVSAIPAADVQATLLELTVQPIAAIARAHHVDRVIACGGGTHNRTLMTRLAHHLENIPLESSKTQGLDPDHVESAGFAWLAQQRWNGLSVHLSAVTGADGDGTLGGLWLP